MKLIAKKHFAKVPALSDIKIDSPIHEGVIHKGSIFTLGTTDELENERNVAVKQLIAQLFHSGCVSDNGDAKAVAVIKREMEVEARAEANAKKMQAQTDNKALTDQMAAMLAKAAR